MRATMPVALGLSLWAALVSPASAAEVFSAVGERAKTVSAEVLEQGERVYAKACKRCHSGGIRGVLSGAPHIRKAWHWERFLNEGVDSMISRTLRGTDDMKPMGGCRACSDEDIAAAVNFIVERVQHPAGD